jgi:hypothetical protein
VFAPRVLHLGLDHLAQLFIPGEAEHVTHSVGFAPLHQFLAAEAGVGPQNDLRLRPRPADLGYDPFHFFFAAGRGILVRRAQARTQQVLATEDVQRQIAVFVVEP